MRAPGYATGLRNAKLDANTTYAGSGAKFVVYSGAQPATGGTAGTVLATFTMGTPFASAASAGALTVNLPADVNAVATATAVWGRLFKSDGTTFVMDLAIGTADAPVIMNSTALQNGVSCSITSFSIAGGNA